MRASAVQRIWLHDDDDGRDAGGADCSAAVRRLFLLAARDFGVCVLLVLVFREFSVHRDVYGGCARAGVATGGFGRPRLGNLVRALGVACTRPENWRDGARDWVDRNGWGAWVAGVEDLPERAGREECWWVGVGSRGRFRGRLAVR